MATDKTASWSLGESVLWYSPNTTLDAAWSLGESFLVDEYEAPVGGLPLEMGPIAFQYFRRMRN